MKSLIPKSALVALALMLPHAAQAHPGMRIEGLGAGLAHPFSGLDHVLTMVAVGIWAASLGGRARWCVPTAFVTVMILGAAIGASGRVFVGGESVMATTVVLIGALIAGGIRVPSGVAMAIVGLFAVFHGYAHGIEVPEGAMPVLYGLGFVAATGLLHAAGLFGGSALARVGAPALIRLAGGAIAALGIVIAAPL
jgi:urease accessory protein